MVAKETPPEVVVNDGRTHRAIEVAADMAGRGLNVIKGFGNILLDAAEDASGLMILRVDRDLRSALDILVETGAADNRRAAARALLKKGVEAESALFKRIHQTRAQIADLRRQMRELVKVQA